ncbi:MAG: serine/threonine-protein kinase [Nostocaceae cyanobacterium]|nr:serine/threonine-protein kinase [Nostocaceae cyanobacterium]
MYWYPGYQLNNGKYIIEKELGQGAFGITYKAIQNTIIQLPVVIKTPNSRLQRDRQYHRYVDKFIQEAKLLGQICQSPHPNIVRVMDYFEEEEGESKTPCLVMEFIAGQDLYNLVENANNQPQPLRESQAVNYILKIGNALVEMHRNSIVHRDIHPGNIMLRKGSEPILIDFGLAGDIAPATSFSRSFGNKNFAPYEQMNGSKEPRVDIYGLAATLYYIVTGEYPTTSWDRKYLQVDLIPPKQHQPLISEQLNQGILAGMELEVNERPQTMQAWLNLLDISEKEYKSLAQSGLISNFQRCLLDSQSASGNISSVLSNDDLSSERDIDYTKLRDLLKAKKWQEADRETYLVMMKAVGKKYGDLFYSDELLNFPSTDLRTIDNLWVKYSNGHFGFSVQKQIYLEVGGIPDGNYDDEVWEKFGDRVGWRMKNGWIGSDNVTYDTESPRGHLPRCDDDFDFRPDRDSGLWTDLDLVFFLLSHPDL